MPFLPLPPTTSTSHQPPTCGHQGSVSSTGVEQGAMLHLCYWILCLMSTAISCTIDYCAINALHRVGHRHAAPHRERNPATSCQCVLQYTRLHLTKLLHSTTSCQYVLHYTRLLHSATCCASSAGNSSNSLFQRTMLSGQKHCSESTRLF